MLHLLFFNQSPAQGAPAELGLVPPGLSSAAAPRFTRTSPGGGWSCYVIALCLLSPFSKAASRDACVMLELHQDRGRDEHEPPSSPWGGFSPAVERTCLRRMTHGCGRESLQNNWLQQKKDDVGGGAQLGIVLIPTVMCEKDGENNTQGSFCASCPQG
ncbi:hypothetical protein AV530_008417 [Patagioenas fasciata monilis]|uniref:Uncharacterized protein n=1 Tax=Patagioenas fasciata monilis TaxID=372326 RepID=A0A1V4JHF5_PATFA|nr:hypothetical protein AV530_008417 [Patagioenas fasciata monilis]